MIQELVTELILVTLTTILVILNVGNRVFIISRVEVHYLGCLQKLNLRKLVAILILAIVVAAGFGVVFGSSFLTQTNPTVTLTRSAVLTVSVTGPPTTETVTTNDTVLLRTTATQTVTIIHTVPNMEVVLMPAQVVSLWKALSAAYGGSNYSSIPANVSVIGLKLFEFWKEGGGGGYNTTSVPYDSVSGLPTQPIIVPYPLGIIVDVPVNLLPLPVGGNQSCVVYLLEWWFAVPSTIPYGGDTWISAATGPSLSSARGLAESLSCPAQNTTTTTLWGM